MNGEQAGAGKPDVPVIVFCNHKGGVAKTTTTVMVAEIFYREFNVPRILVIDCDSQGNASESLSQEDITNIPTIESCIGDPENAKHCISPSFIDGVDIIAANTRLESPIPADIGLGSGIESIPVAYKTSLGAIDEIIKRVKDNYDIISIDTAPNVSPNQSPILAATLPCHPLLPHQHALSVCGYVQDRAQAQPHRTGARRHHHPRPPDGLREHRHQTPPQGIQRDRRHPQEQQIIGKHLEALLRPEPDGREPERAHPFILQDPAEHMPGGLLRKSVTQPAAGGE